MLTSNNSFLRARDRHHRRILPAVRPLAGPLCVGATYDFGDVFGAMHVESLLGRGAVGQVLAVRHADGRGVAVKVVDLKRQSRQQIMSEVTLQRRCAGPYVVAVHGVLFTATHGYVLMEQGDQVSLEERLVRLLGSEHAVSIDEALGYFRVMVAALESCHAHGVVHGDIKPDNFVLVREGPQARARLKLTDFGFACEASQTKNGNAAGTVTHMAPEVLKDAPVTREADMWSLGTSLYRMIMGVEPYYDETPERIAQRVIENKPQFTMQDLRDKLMLSGVNAPTSASICQLIDMLLQPTPYHRWDLGQVRASPAFGGSTPTRR